VAVVAAVAVEAGRAEEEVPEEVWEAPAAVRWEEAPQRWAPAPARSPQGGEEAEASAPRPPPWWSRT